MWPIDADALREQALPPPEAAPEHGGDPMLPPPAEEHDEPVEPLAVEKSTGSAPPAATDAVDQFGRIGRPHSTSKRPPNMIPDVWKMLSAKQRLKAIDEFNSAKQAADGKTTSSSSSMAMVTPITDFPRIPVETKKPNHREKIQVEGNLFNVAVARTVSKKEVLEVPAAQAAVTAEWDKLRKSGCWNESKVKEWSAVAKEAREKGITTHVGRVFEICVEKGASWQGETLHGSTKEEMFTKATRSKTRTGRPRSSQTCLQLQAPWRQPKLLMLMD